MKLPKLILAALALSVSLSAECQEASAGLAQQKIEKLEKIIKLAESQNICTLKERTTVRTAEIFLRYAQWDEDNVEKNINHFSLVHRYKQNAEEMAELLPDFEREEIIAMLDTSISELSSVIDGKTERYYSPDVDWAQTSVSGDEILYNGKPVFLSDWTWKPKGDFFNEYHGAQDGFLLTPSFVVNEKGDVDPKIIAELKAKDSGNMGFVFMNHKSFPEWAIKKDSTILDGQGLAYTEYDINNPLAREVWSDMLAELVPLMKGTNYTKLGYMLCNEPHWNTIEGEWTANNISAKAVEGFREWLKFKHKKISRLNMLWGTDYKNFKEITLPNIMTAEAQGTPLYFDFLSYNMDRVTEWFTFLDSEVKKNDRNALTHIKIMPNLWTDGKRDSGIDMEALTMLTDIIGNDASSCGAWMFGKPQWWESKYSYDWCELLMAHDFYKSISPEKIMYNTEGHFLSTNRSRDLYQSKEYTRQNYWMAHIHGLTAMQTWYWCRTEDGDSRSHKDSKGYAGSNNHQPRVVNEVHQTMADLNSISEDIMSFQRQRKDIRIFYTKASSINSLEYMDRVRECYEKLMFSGIPLGFATEKIIENQDNDSWRVIVIENTPEVFAEDVAALQKYINRGGTVIMDKNSLLTNEYGEQLKKSLKDSAKGELIVCENPTERALGLGIDTKLNVSQSAGTCIWRVIEHADGTKVLNVANLGKEECEITITNTDGSSVKSVVNALNGEHYSDTLTLPVYGTEVLRVN